MLDVAHVDQKCLSVRGSEIELKAICQLENFLAIVQGHSKILLNAFQTIFITYEVSLRW